MTLSARTSWLCSVALYLTGSGNRKDIQESSSAWLAEGDSPSSLFRLADRPQDATREELETWIWSSFDGVGVRPTETDVPWIAAAAMLLRLPQNGAPTTAGGLASIAINFEWTAGALTTALVLSDDLEGGSPIPSGGVESSFADLRSQVRKALAGLQVVAWRGSVVELTDALRDPD
jgi:hypothetical protein